MQNVNILILGDSITYGRLRRDGVGDYANL